MNIKHIVFSLIGAFILLISSTAFCEELYPNTKPGCWIINETCSDDDPDYLYFTGEGKSKNKTVSRRARKAMRRTAQITAMASFSSYLNDTIEKFIQETSICKGTSAEGMECQAAITSKAISYTKSQLRGKDYQVAAEYYSADENTYFMRLKVKNTIADQYLKNVKKIASEPF